MNLSKGRNIKKKNYLYLSKATGLVKLGLSVNLSTHYKCYILAIFNLKTKYNQECHKPDNKKDGANRNWEMKCAASSSYIVRHEKY